MKDVMLLSLIAMAKSEEPVEHDVTLIVSGFLVSGFIVSYENYVKHHSTLATVDAIITELRETSVPEGDEPLDDSPNYIHLRDAQYFVPGNEPIPGNTGVFVRIPLESVHGFTFGKLQYEVKDA